MLQVKILTPNKLFYTGKIESLKTVTVKGELGIFKNHAPLITSLARGSLILNINKSQSIEFFLEEGFLEVQNNFISILTKNINKVSS